MAGQDALDDRMKGYEAAETDRRFDPSLPLVVRLDGRAFSTFTRGLGKPFDARLSKIMRDVTAHLVEQTGARIGYTQSDEITLILDRASDEEEPIFGGRAFKIASVLASMAASKFTLLAHEVWPERVAKIVPSFDCRAFAVPSRIEAVNALVWRELDASRNALQAVAQSRFASDEIHSKSSDELEAMLAAIGVKVTDYPAALRFGRYLARRAVEVTLSEEDLLRIPTQHRPSGPIVRSRVVDLDIAPIAMRADRLDLVFGADARLADATVLP